MSEVDERFAAVAAEIVRLHEAFEVWFDGSLPLERFEPEIAGAMHPDFHLVTPSGESITRAKVLESIRAGHGGNSKFRVAIEGLHLLGAWPDLILAGYVECQTGARTSPRSNRRRSTALFETAPCPRWRHLHESAIPL